MGKVISHMTVSLDGFVADRRDDVTELFHWYQAGDTTVPTANEGIAFSLDEASADLLGDLIGNAGALISGRRLFDLTDGWGDRHPIGTPVVVVTHHPPDDASTRWPNTTFVGDVPTAVAEAIQLAYGKDVILSSPTIIQQALDFDLVDDVWISLAPVLLGSGISLFGPLTADRRVLLDDPTVVEGRRATHLRYPVRHGAPTG